MWSLVAATGRSPVLSWTEPSFFVLSSIESPAFLGQSQIIINGVQGIAAAAVQHNPDLQTRRQISPVTGEPFYPWMLACLGSYFVAKRQQFLVTLLDLMLLLLTCW